MCRMSKSSQARAKFLREMFKKKRLRIRATREKRKKENRCLFCNKPVGPGYKCCARSSCFAPHRGAYL